MLNRTPRRGFRFAIVVGACLFARAAVAGVGQWTALGPYDGTGTPIPCQSLAISPDGATIYAGTDSAVYRSDDAGVHWRRFNVPTPGGIPMLLLSPGTPSVLYAGTATGFFVSTDRGETWTASGLDGQAVYTLAIDPQSPATLYAGAWLPVFPEKAVISRSRDGGMHWEQLYAEAYVGPVVALAIDPIDPSVLFAGTSDGGVLMRSLDAGATWAQVDPSYGDIRSILIDSVSPSIVYESWGSGLSPGGFPPAGRVRKSLDGGSSWFDVPGLPQFSVGRMVIDPRSPSVLVVEADGQLLRTLDGGEHWAAIAPAIYADELLTDPSNPETLYGAGYGGVERLGSIPGPCVPSATALCLQEGRFRVEAAWQLSPSGPSMQAQAVPVTSEAGYFWFFDPDNVEVMVKVLDGTAINGHFWVFYGALSNVQYTVRVTDTLTGETKTYENTAGTLASVADTAAFRAAAGSSAAPAMGLKATPVGRSTAASWSAIGPPERGVYGIAVDPRYPQVYAATGGESYTVLKTNDGGGTWVALVSFPEFVSEIHLDLHSPDIVYAVTASTLYRSQDAGGTWQTIAAGLGAASLAFDSYAAGTIYAGTPTGFFVSTDHGSTWALRGAELVGKPVGPIVTTSSGAFYAVANANVLWASTDSGLSWSQVHEFPYEALTSLVASPFSSSTVYVSAACCGAWPGSTPLPIAPLLRSDDGGSTWAEILRIHYGANLIALDPSDPSVLYSGGSHGVLRSANGGTSWTEINEGLSGQVFTLELAQGSTLFAGTTAGVFELDLAGFPQSCQPAGHTLCLNDSRFQVEAAFQLSPSGPVIQAQAVPLTGDTGYFWFFEEASVELVVKVLDGRPVNGHFWVFYGALSSVEYTITVRDTQTGDVRTYHNDRGNLASVADTSAF